MKNSRQECAPFEIFQQHRLGLQKTQIAVDCSTEKISEEQAFSAEKTCRNFSFPRFNVSKDASFQESYIAFSRRAWKLCINFMSWRRTRNVYLFSHSF